MKRRARTKPHDARAWKNPLDDPATFERIDNLLGTLARDPERFDRFERNAPDEERLLIMLYAARDRGDTTRRPIACMLSLSWQYPDEYGLPAPLAKPLPLALSTVSKA